MLTLILSNLKRDIDMTDTELKEHSLVVRLINDDEAAFCELYSLYKNRLIYFVVKFIKSRELAEDIFHDVFTIVWKCRKFINPDSSFSSFLFTIVRNRVLNIIRDQKKEEAFKEYVLKNAIDYTNNTKESIFESDLLSLISIAVEKLTPRQQEIYKMSRNKQMSHHEIAETLGISINTVNDHISDSLRIIRVYLSKYSDIYLYILLLHVIKTLK